MLPAATVLPASAAAPLAKTVRAALRQAAMRYQGFVMISIGKGGKAQLRWQLAWIACPCYANMRTYMFCSCRVGRDTPRSAC